MHERGRVITVHDGAVDVRMESAASCEGCSACTRAPSGETIMRSVSDSLGATIGDTVDIIIPDSIRTKAAAAVFIVPVIAMFIGYLAGFLLGRQMGWEPDISGLVGALASANIAFIGVKRAERQLASDAQYTPKVNAIISRSHDRI